MKYHSTRGKTETAGAKEAILRGLCRNGGLFVSDALSAQKIDPERLLQKDYREIAKEVLLRWFPEYGEDALTESIQNAYGKTFSAPDITPLTRIGGDWLLELYHGPTSAFKDVALCMLPQLLSKALAGSGKRAMIVTATSGDTGKAALCGFCGVPDTAITVFYPEGKVSDIQYLQMAAQEGENVCVCGVKGNFDDAQSAVKAVFASEIDAALSERNLFLSSANSINIGRLVPQIVYYFESYKQLRLRGVLSAGDEVSFCVPTGNFGDVLAGYYAKRMGLPVRRLIVASNENRVLTDFFETGIYDRRRAFHQTISPSMDILISSNLERLLYEASGGDTALCASLMQDLKETGRYEIGAALLGKLRETFSAGCADNAETKAAIRGAYEETGRLIDPHTAVGFKVMREQKEAGEVCVLLSTASPYKFCRDVYEAIFGEREAPFGEGSAAGYAGAGGKTAGEKPEAGGLKAAGNGFWYMDRLYEKTGEEPPRALRELREKPILHREVIEVSQMKDYVFRKTLEKLG